MHTIQTDAILTRFSSRVDGSLSFAGVTPELTTPEKVAMMDLHNRNVRILIQPIDEAPEALTEIKAVLDFKTPGQRLRNALFCLYKKEKPVDTVFDTFYIAYMEKLIDKVKERLENP